MTKKGLKSVCDHGSLAVGRAKRLLDEAAPPRRAIMQRTWLGGLAAVLATAVIGSGSARAADAPFVGNWKVNLIQGAQEITLALIQIEDKAGKLQAKTLPSAAFKTTAIKDFKADAGAVHFTLTADDNEFAVLVYVPKGEAAPKKMLGTLRIGSVYELGQLERTDKKEITRKESIAPIAGAEDLEKAGQAGDLKGLVSGLKGVMDKHAGKPIAFVAAKFLLQILPGAKDADPADVKAAADTVVKAAAPYGREAVVTGALLAAQALARVEKGAPAAVEFARKAEKLLTGADPLGRQAAAVKTLVMALRRAGKEDEAKSLQTRLAKLHEQLDREFEKTAIPFKPEPYPGRKGKSERIALVELFTGAQCPPCVAADVAFDAALRTYKPSQAIFLQYHLHVPRPDPLTNADAERREKYYGDEIQGTPTAFVNGKAAKPMGGPKALSKSSYDALKEQTDEELEKDADGKIKLVLERKGDKINVKAEVSDLAKAGEKVRLRLVLVEDVVPYAGTNGQRLHHHVVRAFPGGTEGFALNRKKPNVQNLTVSLTEVGKGLNEYLDGAGKKQPFLDDDRPLDLKHLKIVAFVQDDETKEILQAAQTDVPEAN
jgi:hypothetical protein